MTTALYTLGIDIAKASYHVSLKRPDGKRRQKSLRNNPVGHAALLAWLTRQAPEAVHACLESTGTYGEAVATALVDAGHRVSMVNPAAVKAFAQSQLRRTKTDGVDADVLADFCAALAPALWTPWPREVRALQGLVRRRDAVQEMRTQESNRKEAGGLTPSVEASLDRVIDVLDAELQDLDRQIREHLDQHPTLRQQRDLLSTIPGIGVATVARLLAECRAITDFETARAYAAFAGLVPRERQSGQRHPRAHLSKLGTPRLRYALFFPALTALRVPGPVKQFGARLRAAGKPKMVVVAAVMRKLLHIVYGVLKHQRAFNPQTLGA
jgi:transposase